MACPCLFDGPLTVIEAGVDDRLAAAKCLLEAVPSRDGAASAPVTLALYPVMVLLYVLLARREEKEMIARFGEEYLAYRRRTPLFLPRWAEWGRLFKAADQPGQ